MSMWGMLAALASSQCCWSPRTHTENLGLGRLFSLGGKQVSSDSSQSISASNPEYLTKCNSLTDQGNQGVFPVDTT